jgi:hypothetical protein
MIGQWSLAATVLMACTSHSPAPEQPEETVQVAATPTPPAATPPRKPARPKPRRRATGDPPLRAATPEEIAECIDTHGRSCPPPHSIPAGIGLACELGENLGELCRWSRYLTEDSAECIARRFGLRDGIEVVSSRIEQLRLEPEHWGQPSTWELTWAVRNTLHRSKKKANGQTVYVDVVTGRHVKTKTWKGVGFQHPRRGPPRSRPCKVDSRPGPIMAPAP